MPRKHEAPRRSGPPLEFGQGKMTVSYDCGIVMNDSVDSRAIAELMARKPGVRVTYLPGMIRIDGEGKVEFKMDEIGEVLGREMTPRLFELSTSAHYGHMVLMDDNTVTVVGNLGPGMAYEQSGGIRTDDWFEAEFQAWTTDFDARIHALEARQERFLVSLGIPVEEARSHQASDRRFEQEASRASGPDVAGSGA